MCATLRRRKKVLFASPTFSPQFSRFRTALRAQGVNVLGLGDTPPGELSQELHAALGDYAHVPNLDRDDDGALRAVARPISKRGRLSRVESHNEYWLSLEARLREDFDITGPRLAPSPPPMGIHSSSSQTPALVPRAPFVSMTAQASRPCWPSCWLATSCSPS